VVRDGLQPDEVVLVNGLQRVRPGAKVDAAIQPMDATAPATTTPATTAGAQ
jgi:hypothetical protein